MIPIVDRQDVVIGHKERADLTPQDICRVTGLWILNEKGEILCARRAYTKKFDAGRLGNSAAGTVEEGETYESNIIKEAKEELGIDIVAPHTGKKEYIQAQHKFFVQWFWLVIPSETKFVIEEDEVVEVKWLSRDALLEEYQQNPHEFLEIMEHALPAIPTVEEMSK